ncbi:hypothetical protein AAVH_10428 [Aphelenchoides avenae]|nr:hypothetical protein AAVH_10428 [Aphelenchus avenae]
MDDRDACPPKNETICPNDASTFYQFGRQLRPDVQTPVSTAVDATNFVCSFRGFSDKAVFSFSAGGNRARAERHHQANTERACTATITASQAKAEADNATAEVLAHSPLSANTADQNPCVPDTEAATDAEVDASPRLRQTLRLRRYRRANHCCFRSQPIADEDARAAV